MEAPEREASQRDRPPSQTLNHSSPSIQRPIRLLAKRELRGLLDRRSMILTDLTTQKMVKKVLKTLMLMAMVWLKMRVKIFFITSESIAEKMQSMVVALHK